MESQNQWEVFTQRVRENLPQLTKTQRIVADYLANHFEQIAFNTAGSLAKQMGVSESSVLRLVYVLGYDGYNDLQNLAQETLLQGSTLDRVRQSVAALDDDQSFLQRSFNLDLENIRTTQHGIRQEDFEQTVDWILAAEAIWVWGLRSSVAPAQFLAMTLNAMLGNTTLLGLGAGDWVEQLQRVKSGDLVFVIGHQRYTMQTVQVAQVLRKRGARLVIFTDSVSSPLVPFGDIVFNLRLDSLHFMGSLTAVFALFNALLTGVAVRKQDEVLANLQEMEDLYKHFRVFHSHFFRRENGLHPQAEPKDNQE